MAMMAPSLLFLPLGGLAADRGNPRKLLLRYHVLYAIPPLVLAGVLAMGGLSYPLLIAYGVAAGSISAFAIPTRDALLPTVAHIYFEGMLWVKMLTFPIGLMFFRTLPRMRTLALWLHILMGTISAGIGLVQYFALNQRDLEHRITGPVTHVMTFSGLLLPISLMVIILAVHLRKWWLWVPASIVTLTLLLTFTRSIWIGWISAIFAVLLFTRPKMLAWAAPALVLFITFMPLSLFGRMISIFDTRQESNLDRIRMAEAGVEIIRDYPLLGVGPANVKEIYPLYRRHDAPRFRIPHLHNTILQIWAERGSPLLRRISFCKCCYPPMCEGLEGSGQGPSRRSEWPSRSGSPLPGSSSSTSATPRFSTSCSTSMR